MGQNLILNMDSKGFIVCAFNRTVEKVYFKFFFYKNRNTYKLLIFNIVSKVHQFLNNEAKGTNIIGATSMQDMADKLKSPRRVMLLVKGISITLHYHLTIL